jgi:hypothetical protein
MTNLASLDLPTLLGESRKLISCGKTLLVHVERSSKLAHQQTFRHLTDYLLGELEKAVSTAEQTQALKLASVTRNLFELSFEVEYVCKSDANMERFIVDVVIDELEIMEKFLEIDKQDPNYQSHQKSQEREKELRAQIEKAGLTGSGPLRVETIAKQLNRLGEYKSLFKVYSKMTHATAWAILGRCSWDAMVLLLLAKSNCYAAGCMSVLAKKTGLPAATAAPTA